MAAAARRPATFEDLALRDDSDRLEIIGGEIVEKASPSPSHGRTEIKIGVAVDPFNRKGGPRGPGGWWIFTEIHVGYPPGEVFCHDTDATACRSSPRTGRSSGPTGSARSCRPGTSATTSS